MQHIQVGRVNEITALHQDIERIADGGASFRLIIGEYGYGKTFFLECCALYCAGEEVGVSQC
ncbi:BREX system ATP-binding domain-containing protein [Klebsiella pneumoniae]|uniref:BREX system ATP-binding domain-containing protein n=1 Tax=Klebsiella pneumoniae TaxID=573 RepID=UPI00396F733E